tara:strand:+ start:356 stop:799 length:444 start_codon:yes stop_codon:yes gene_type:complete
MMKGLIYKITSNNKIYIGSTQRTIKERLSYFNHRAFTKYGFDKYDYTIEILEEIEYTDKLELFKLEGKYVIKYDCVNKSLPCGLGKDKKKYDNIRYEKNKEDKKLKAIKWNKNNKEKKDEYNKKRREWILSWGGDPRNNNNLLQIKT